jgi:NAD(P)-dependent dehydrogenase (short-subunit alcohol dehydrogenase family)
VTGAGSGIGRATSILLAEKGAAVVVADIRETGAAQTVERIAQGGGQASLCVVDVSSGPAVERMIQTAEDDFGGLDIVVNNAAVQIVATLSETTEEMWELVHNVNLKGVFLTIKAAVPALLRRGGGSIVNVASILGLVADPTLAAYCAAKGGLLSLSRVAALTYGPQNIRVNCVCPGDVETPLVQAYFDASEDPAKVREQVAQNYAIRRIATPEEIAQAIAFLASSDSSFVTGASLIVDGGLTVRCY